MKKGDEKLIVDGLNIGLLCRIIEVKERGSVLVSLYPENLNTTHEPEYALKEPTIENAFLVIKNLQKFNEAKSKIIDRLEEKVSTLENRCRKLLDAKF